jgi:hypothetical protein
MEAEYPISMLQERLERGHVRLDSATLGSPEWDAARANTDALEHQIESLRPQPVVDGSHILSRLGPMVLEDGCVVHGLIAALGPEGEALRVEISWLPDRVHSQGQFVAALQGLVRGAGFILEVEPGDHELNFYAYDSEAR